MREEILFWLREKDPEKLKELWARADRLRAENVGDAVHFRGLIELSSFCRRNCLYCGIRASRPGLTRYRLTREEALSCVQKAVDFGYGTVVIQAGEDPGIDQNFITDLIREIKARSSLIITLSLGERKEEEWIAWKEAGADRYLLRFETSNQILYNAIHPKAPDTVWPNRLDLLRRLREIGYEIGSGVMIGIPGQSIDDLARDIELFQELDLDMIGCGPYLAHPDTPLGKIEQDPDLGKQYGLPATEDPVESSNEMAFKVIALARLVCPSANIPSTTAIATIDGKQGRTSGLSRGANVIMPNLTPMEYRALYEIYPHKAAALETAEQTHAIAIDQVKSIGRFPGSGPGGRKK